MSPRTFVSGPPSMPITSFEAGVGAIPPTKRPAFHDMTAGRVYGGAKRSNSLRTRLAIQ
jgi:hypothetical protein